MIGLNHYLIVSAILFAIGMIGVMRRKNLLLLFFSTEIMLNAVIILFAAISHFTQDISGYIVVFFIIAMAAAEAAIGLTLVVLIYKKFKAIYSEEIANFKG